MVAAPKKDDKKADSKKSEPAKPVKKK